MSAGNLLVAQGGGPTAVVNLSLLGVVEEARKSGINRTGKIIGALHSIDGIMDENFIDLGRERPASLRNVAMKPGAALGSCRRKMAEEDYGRIVDILRKYDVRYFFYIGGNGSMHTVYKVEQIARSVGYELNAIGVPKTIDNDLAYTDHCPGFGSAAKYFASVTREIGLDVESLPPPVSVIETLGRNTGWLAASASLARENDGDAPNLIYFPERVFNLGSFLSDVSDVYDRWGRAVIVVSEGLKDKSGQYLGGVNARASRDGFGRDLPGGAASFLAARIAEKLKLRARSEKPGLAARTAVEYASSVDRKEAYLVGQQAVRAALKGKSGIMVTLERAKGDRYRCSVGEAPLESVAISEKLLPSKFINTKGNHVTTAFQKYLLPIVGDPIRAFAELSGYRLAKKASTRRSTGRKIGKH